MEEKQRVNQEQSESNETIKDVIKGEINKNNTKHNLNSLMLILVIILVIEAILISYFGKPAWEASEKQREEQRRKIAQIEENIKEEADPAKIFVDSFSTDGEFITLTIKGRGHQVIDDTDYTIPFISEFFTKQRMDLEFGYKLSIAIKYESLVFNKENGVEVKYNDEDFYCSDIEIDDITMVEESYFLGYIDTIKIAVVQKTKDKIKSILIEDKKNELAIQCLEQSKKGLEVLLCNFAYGAGLKTLTINGTQFNTIDYNDLDNFSVTVLDAFKHLELT